MVYKNDKMSKLGASPFADLFSSFCNYNESGSCIPINLRMFLEDERGCIRDPRCEPRTL